MSKLISVIMSTYNESEEWLRKSINSILMQTYTNLELIIVLDNPDNIKNKILLHDISEKDSRIKLIINERNLGLVASLNKALKIASGYYIARMDADDISVEERLARQIEYIENNNIDFVFSGLNIIDEFDQSLYNTNVEEIGNKQVSKILKIANISNHPTWFLKKSIYDDLEGYRELKYCEDYDFTLRSLKKGYKIGKMPGYVLQYRIRQDSISRKFSLVQYLNSKGILEAYNNDSIFEDVTIQSILQNSSSIATENQIKKFTHAERLFNESVIDFKNKEILNSIKNIIGSMTRSKYFREKNLGLFKYKLVS